jgi:hypothetical protein
MGSPAAAPSTLQRHTYRELNRPRCAVYLLLLALLPDKLRHFEHSVVLSLQLRYPRLGIFYGCCNLFDLAIRFQLRISSMGHIQLRWLLLTLVNLTCISLAAGIPVGSPRVCYTSKGKLAPGWVLPCFEGTIDDGDVYGCCIAGDYCLVDQTCFNVNRKITYQKGCTSSEYDGTKCPRKCETDQTKADWVGLIYCNGTNGTPKDTWVRHMDCTQRRF